MAENTIILPQVEELLESQGNEKLIVEIDGELKRLGINLLNINTDEVVPIERGGTGANNGATGLANLFAAGPTLLSANQYGAEFPEDTVANTMFFKEATGTIADIGQDMAKALRARNLLDNSDFRNPVNQRGASSYTGSKYHIDRWRAWDDVVTTTINDGYITVSGGTIVQYINCAQTVYSAFGCKLNGEIVALNAGYEVDYAGGVLCVQLPKGDWVWAALYEGEYTAETLPPYVPKDYGAELAECKRYYQVIPYTIVKRANNYDETYYFDAMRATPTATIYSMNAVVDKASYYTGNWADMDVIIMVWNEPFGGSIRLYALEPSNCNFGFAKITLSADL